jgi:hypothetical protein
MNNEGCISNLRFLSTLNPSRAMLVPLQGIPKGRRESQCLRRAAGAIAINYMRKFELHP